MSKFTEGPWGIEFEFQYAINGGCKHVAMVSSFISSKEEEQENIANANLIAAAPDMYEALEKAYKMIHDSAQQGWYPPIFLSENGGDGIGFMNEALKKARGEK
jgi:hypothetical protein